MMGFLIWLGSKMGRLWKDSFFFRLNSLFINCRSFRVLTKALLKLSRGAQNKYLHCLIALPTLLINIRFSAETTSNGRCKNIELVYILWQKRGFGWRPSKWSIALIFFGYSYGITSWEILLLIKKCNFGYFEHHYC